MSYLGSILASIGGDSAPVATPASVDRAPPAAQKRKADDQLTDGPAKRPTTPANVQNGIPKRSTTSSNVQNGTAPKAKPAVSAAQGVYKGSAQVAATGVVKKPDTKAQTTSFAPVAVSKPFPKPATAPSAASATNAAKPTPKKGSYADILARAKAAQEAKPPIGVITHKQAEKVDKKKERLPEGAKGKNVPLRAKSAGDRSRTGSADVPLKNGDKLKPKLKPIEKITYTGTAKPTTPVYTGSAQPGRFHKPAAKRNNNSYADTDDDMIDDEEEEEEEDDYGSDSDDMEAGAFDIDQEEEYALRQAKKDDAAELALENRLKNEKLKRKQQLEQLAAAAKARKKPS